MLALMALCVGAVTAQAADRHGLSAFDVLKYPADFKHFEWVNPDAPKGGRLALIGPAARTTFDNLNAFILKGDAAQGLDLLFDSLMTRSPDEPDAVYGLVARSADLAPDRSAVTFHMRPEAKFADGTPITSADVVFSFDTLKTKGHPNIRGQLRDIASAVAVDAHTVRFDFTGALTRDLPLVAAGLPILSKAYYATREFDLREEFTAVAWVTGYYVPAVKAGKLLRIALPDESPSGAQGFFLNTRRPKLADARVRKALDYVFDFQFANKTIFYDLYTRTESFFENSAMKATGKPSAEELVLLEPFKTSLPPEVFDEPYRPPVSDGSGKDRKLLQAADKLLNEAGWTVKNGVRVNPKGEVFDLEFLIVDPVSERVLSNYVENLKRLGLAISIRRVDPAQYQRRVKSFDFDVVTARYSLRLTPGVELRSYWGSENANVDGSLNLAGISSPVIDTLIGKVVEAKSRAELEVVTRALDRVLRAGHYWVPQWYKPIHHIAHWDRFSRPAIKPRYDRGIVDTWWYDAAKAERLRSN
jgi:ABC-type oligopeptide transport system substrate-binding subunit